MSYDTNALTLAGQNPSFYSGGQVAAPTTKTANYTATGADCVILCNPASGNITITLPVTNITAGKVFYVKRITSLLNILTVVVTGGALIDGAASAVVSALTFADMQVVFDGTNYFIL